VTVRTLDLVTSALGAALLVSLLTVANSRGAGDKPHAKPRPAPTLAPKQQPKSDERQAISSDSLKEQNARPTSGWTVGSTVRSIVVGLIVWLLTTAFHFFITRWWRSLRRQKFASLFGKDAVDTGQEYSIVYPEFRLPKSYPRHVYEKPEYRPGNEDLRISIDRPVSQGDTRGANYLTTLFDKEAARTPSMVSDFDVDTRLDISMVALGSAGSNNKTFDIMRSEHNKLIAFKANGFACKTDEPAELMQRTDASLGFILAIEPIDRDGRKWIVCAGHGEWGTSGAAWYLARHWKKLQRDFKDRDFAAIVEVTIGQDESASLLACADTADELEQQLRDKGRCREQGQATRRG